jgi:glutathione S-transferase
MRLALAEYGVTVSLVEERPWQPSQQVLDLNPAGLTPIYVEDNGVAVAGAEALSEYLEETLGAERAASFPASALASAPKCAG